MSTQKLDLRHIDLVFVYGTLKSGHSNNRLLSTATLIGEGVTEGLFTLVNSGYPLAVPPHGQTTSIIMPVRGEVWQIDSPNTLRRLDILEGHPRNYYRTLEKVNGQLVWMYNYPYTGIITGSDYLCPIINGAYQWES
jgi:gamma-glutamylcyclotransferase (GGCT)/AIG2-like uncharacterized protein YtfP